MNTLIHADIFFFITTIAVILLTILLIVAFFYIIKILRNLRDVSETIKHEGNLIAADIDLLREQAKDEGFKAVGVLRIVGVMLRRLFRHQQDDQGHSHTHKNKNGSTDKTD